MTGGYRPWSKFNAHSWSLLNARRQSPRRANGGNGRVARVDHSTGYGADQPFEGLLCRSGDRQVMAYCVEKLPLFLVLWYNMRIAC